MSVNTFIIGDPIKSPIIKKIEKPLKVKKEHLTLQPLLADDLKHTYKVSFIIIGPENRRVDMRSFRKAIIDNISSYDKQYMELKSFTRKKAIFHLNTKKWFNDTLRGVRPTTILASFSKKYKLKKRIPDMILTEVLSQNFDKFLLRHFKIWLERNKRGLLKFFNLKNRSRITNLFDYDYDKIYNTITVRLKTIFRVGLLYGIKRAAFSKKRPNYSFGFRVQRNMPSYNRGRWNKSMGRRKYI